MQKAFLRGPILETLKKDDVPLFPYNFPNDRNPFLAIFLRNPILESLTKRTRLSLYVPIILPLTMPLQKRIGTLKRGLKHKN